MVGNDAFQEADIIGMTRTVTKHSYLIKSTKDLSKIFQEAFHISRTGRPGPVLIDIPKDVILGSAKETINPKVIIRGYKPTTQGHPRQIKRVSEAIKNSKQSF